MVFSISGGAFAGTTGGLTGRVLDKDTGAPLSGVTVLATSPSQSATVQTDATGSYAFLSLAPDTYALSFQRTGYEPISQPGFSVFADQTQSLTVSLVKQIKEIGRVSSRSSADLIKPGTTSDVYSVNTAGQEAASALGGPGGLNNAYSAVASVPGTNVAQGQQGWFQTVNIRGGDIDQVGYELDGIPVNRAYDNAPQTMLSGLGQQELQVYTGGTPASADASGIAGYINQVIRTGTHPGYANIALAVGGPVFYHKLSAEAGGSTPDRNFSYYVGLAGMNQDYRYLDQNNGVSDARLFYPVNVFGTSSGVYDGGAGATAVFAPGNSYAIANTNQRDNVVNLHVGLPHRHDAARDDMQLLWLTSEVFAAYYSSINDLGGPAAVYGATNGGAPIPFQDQLVYNGPVGASFNPALVANYYFPSTTMQRSFGATPVPLNARDYNDNGVGIVKFQYQRNINAHSYARLYAYTLYSNWFIYGPLSQFLPYGAEIGDYEIPNHTYGANLSYANQLTDKHLLSASVSYTGSNLQRKSTSGFPFTGASANITNYADAAGNCYQYTTGLQTSCYTDPLARGYVTQGVLPYASTATPGTAPAGSAAALAGAQWVVTESGYRYNLNQVRPRFAAASITDQWRPNDKTTINAGLRVENYTFLLGDTTGPARNFWFNAYNNEYCIGTATPTQRPVTPGPSPFGPCPAGTVAANLVNDSGGTLSATVWQPRLGFTYQINPNTVLRGSFGVYARPENSSWVQYNTVQQDLPTFLGKNFGLFGFNSPRHNIRPDVSYNYDLSLEHAIANTDLSFKLTPFYRSTRDQLQNFFINALTGLESGLNVGSQRSYGVELAVRKGDFSKNGLSAQLSYTYTNSRIKYNNFPGSNRNIIDLLNDYVTQYNSYTSACAGAAATQAYCAGAAYSSNAAPLLPNATGSGNVVNPYYNNAPQPLFDRNGNYSTYDIIPAPFAAGNGYETPHVLSLIVNWKKDRFNVTPSLTWSSGAKYGSPLSWPGYVPQTCTDTGVSNPQNCGNTALNGNPFFIPDAFTNKFDNLGDFKQPSRLTMNLSMGYAVTDRVKATAIFTGLIDSCKQRGYAWDDPNICVYSTLPSGILAPVGNFMSQAAAPVQLKYPYAVWLNNANTGFLGTKIPFQATFAVQFKF